jgi:hypothetical protein
VQALFELLATFFFSTKLGFFVAVLLVVAIILLTVGDTFDLY